MGDDNRYTLDRIVRLVLSSAGVIALFLLLHYLSDVLVPFVAAVVLAYLLNPLVCAFERKTNHRGVAVGLTLGGLGLVGIVLVVVIVPLTVSQAGRFRDSLQQLRDDLHYRAAKSAVLLAPEPSTGGDDASVDDAGGDETGEGVARSPETSLGWRELLDGWAAYRRDAGKISQRERLQRLRESLEGTYIGDTIGRLVSYTKSEEFNAFLVQSAKRLLVGGWTVVAFVLNVILALTGLIIVLLYLVFLLVDYPAYEATWKAFLPPAYRETIVEFLDQFSIAMRRYFRGQALVALLMGVVFAAGFTVIGLPMAVPLGLFIGLLNMVPYLQIVGAVPAVLLAGLRAIESDASFVGSLLLAAAVFVVAQVLQDAVIVPRIMGKATGLRPVAILLGVFIWGKLLGFLGLLMAIPLTCLGIAYYRRYVLLHSAESSKLTEE